MKVSLELLGLEVAEAEKVLAFAKRLCADAGAESEGGEDIPDDGGDTPAPAKKKPAKKGKDPMDMGDDEPETEDEPESDDESAPAKKGKAKGPTVEDVIEAMQAYAEEHDRKAAIKKLAKYKVKSVHDLDEKYYPALLKELKV